MDQNQNPTPGIDIHNPVSQPMQDVPGVGTPQTPQTPGTVVPDQGVPTPGSNVPGQGPTPTPTPTPPSIGEVPGVPQAPFQDPNQVPGQPGPSVPPAPQSPPPVGEVNQPGVQTPGAGTDQNQAV